MSQPQVIEVLKRDALGRVEKLAHAGGFVARRVACGGSLPGSGLAARILLARERRSLAALEGLTGVPHLVDDETLRALPGPDGDPPRARETLLRSWIEGEPLHRAERLAHDFFEHLEQLVATVHARGVCHNDLHKEQNIVVDADGYPALIDFQLASVHRPGSRLFNSRVHDDLRHVRKHRRRYTRGGRGPAEVALPEDAGGRLPRTPVSFIWRRFAKPVYVGVTRGLLRTRDGEERRPSSGPWPEWGPALGPRSGRA